MCKTRVRAQFALLSQGKSVKGHCLTCHQALKVTRVHTLLDRGPHVMAKKRKLPSWADALMDYEILRRPMDASDWGEIKYEEGQIIIQSRTDLASQLRTLLHECLHWRWPNRKESEILSLEEKKWEALKPDELRALLDALYPEED